MACQIDLVFRKKTNLVSVGQETTLNLQKHVGKFKKAAKVI